MSSFGLPFDDPRAETGAERPSPSSPQRAEPRSLPPSSGRSPQSPPAENRAAPAVPERKSLVTRRVLTVTELTGEIRSTLEDAFVDVWVQGEISNYRLWNTGHAYFTLKDAGAQVKAVIFRSAVRLLRFKPQDGLHVVVRGRVSVYDPKGEYQLVCEHVEPRGLGALQLAFDQVRARLAAEGLFDEQRKRPLPALPRKIGVVTSLDGAAVRDIITVLRRRYANAHVVVRPTRVQGDGAALEIARGIAAVGAVEGVDVVIVGRGGGSIEDLWAFNEEVVARAIAACAVPVISAVGHETDVTIADFVADRRAPTPSAADEMVVARKDEFAAGIDRLAHRLRATTAARLHRSEARLRGLEARPGYAGIRGRVAMRARHAGELAHDLRRATRTGLVRRERRYQTLRFALERFDLRRRLGEIRTRLVAADAALASAAGHRRLALEARLGRAAARLDSLSPLAVLGRGYAVCWSEDRTAILRSAAEVAVGDRVRVTLEHGALTCDVTAID
jgi:exodeoxyribonuclease VII large subunit